MIYSYENKFTDRRLPKTKKTNHLLVRPQKKQKHINRYIEQGKGPEGGGKTKTKRPEKRHSPAPLLLFFCSPFRDISHETPRHTQMPQHWRTHVFRHSLATYGTRVEYKEYSYINMKIKRSFSFTPRAVWRSSLEMLLHKNLTQRKEQRYS